jgi:hypothetical protein
MISSKAVNYLLHLWDNIRHILLDVAVVALFSLITLTAWADTGSFTVHFTDCTEFAGWGPVSLAEAQPLASTGYTIAGAGMGHASIVVRATSCQGVSIGQSAAKPTEISQIGINLVAPDGTGDINNYTLIYVTNNQALAEHLGAAGAPAVFDPQLNYEYTPGPMETSGELYMAASGTGLPAYFLFGTENEPPPNSQQKFVANWWFSGHGIKIKQSTLFPAISFGSAAVTLYTSRTSLLGNLIGGNTASNFSFLSVRGVYPTATMTVSFKPAGDK